MTTLNEIMSPKSIAIVGASDNKGRIGGRPLAHMIEQKFSGGIYPINPNRDTVQGLKAYPSLLDVKDDLDFVLVAVPSNIVVSVIEQAVQKNAKTALIFSSGFSVFSIFALHSSTFLLRSFKHSLFSTGGFPSKI